LCLTQLILFCARIPFEPPACDTYDEYKQWLIDYSLKLSDLSRDSSIVTDSYRQESLMNVVCTVWLLFTKIWFIGGLVVGTCEASWFDSITNRTSDSRFDSYWWSDLKFSNRVRCQSAFVKKRLVVVKFVFKVDFGSKISVQQHCLTRFMPKLK